MGKFCDKKFTIHGVSFNMVKVEGGVFNMGCNDNDAERDEGPVHKVTVSSFFIGETEVTQALWKAVMGSNPSYFCNEHSGCDDDLDRPVEQVSWDDCQKFLSELNRLTGQRFRLPSEAEWEYAARGGAQGNGFVFAGSNTLNDVAWYWRNSGDTILEGTDEDRNWRDMDANHCGTHAVKTKAPNELSIYDMVGNVWEWCLDWYDDYSSGSQNDPKNLEKGINRVLRGGSWCSGAGVCRVSNRNQDIPDTISDQYGLRLCLPVDDESTMHIILKDEKNVGDSLLDEGYSQRAIQEAEQTIKQEFEKSAKLVFSEVLGRKLPDSMVIRIEPKLEEYKWEERPFGAAFELQSSTGNHIEFRVFKTYVKMILDNKDARIGNLGIHEMIHAADLPVLNDNKELLLALGEIDDDAPESEACAQAGLFEALLMCYHYRSEGIAILGECMLTHRQFGPVADALKSFSNIFVLTMLRSQQCVRGNFDENDFDEENWYKAYSVAPCVLLMVLEKCGLIKNELAKKALDGLNTGHYDLSDDEIATIIRSSQSLTLSDYIMGLTLLGDDVAPVLPFLKFCAEVQNAYNVDDMDAFVQLVQQPKTKEAFIAAIQQITDRMLPMREIDKRYRKFCEDATDVSAHLQMKEKIDDLYDLMKSDDNPERKRIAQWALTYLFDDKDVIHDDIKGFGFVDDMIVIDNALNLIFDNNE